MRCDFALPERQSSSPSEAKTGAKAEAWPWAALLLDFITYGYSEELFWSLTLRQIETHLIAARRRYRIERNRMMETAYYAACVPHMKKPTPLKDLLLPVDETPRRRKQSAEEIKAVLMLAFGGPKNG